MRTRLTRISPAQRSIFRAASSVACSLNSSPTAALYHRGPGLLHALRGELLELRHPLVAVPPRPLVVVEIGGLEPTLRLGGGLEERAALLEGDDLVDPAVHVELRAADRADLRDVRELRLDEPADGEDRDDARGHVRDRREGALDDQTGDR